MFERLQNEIKQAMLTKNSVKRDCLRGIVSEIKNLTVNAGKEITDDACMKVIQKSAKMHKDSIEQFQQAGRDDLVQKEKSELEVIEQYLPRMLSEEETKEVINNILQNIEPLKRNFGLIMKQLPKEADKKLASLMLNKILK